MDLGPLEADFAALKDDLERLETQTISFGNGAVEALQQIVAEGGDAGDSPIGVRFQQALVGLLRDAAAADMHGNLRFDLDQKSLASHGTPVLQEAVVMLQGAVQSFFDNLSKPADLTLSTRVPDAPAPGPDPAPGPAPVKVNVDLGALLTNLLSNAQVKPTPKG